MICKNCGSELPDAAKFCPYCGKKTVEEVKPKKICPECKKEYENNRVFCMDCGMRLVELSEKKPHYDENPQSSDKQVNKKFSAGEEILALNAVTYYEGEPTVSYKSQLGKLIIYSDKLLFKSVFENKLLVPIRGFAALGKTKEFPIAQISQVREGKYLGMYHSLVIAMRDAQTHSFVPAVPGPNAAIQGAIITVRELQESYWRTYAERSDRTVSDRL